MNIRSFTCNVTFITMEGSVPWHVGTASNMQSSVPYHAITRSTMSLSVPLRVVIRTTMQCSEPGHVSNNPWHNPSSQLSIYPYQIISTHLHLILLSPCETTHHHIITTANSWYGGRMVGRWTARLVRCWSGKVVGAGGLVRLYGRMEEIRW